MGSTRNETAYGQASAPSTSVVDAPVARKPIVNEGQRLLLELPGSHSKVGASVGAHKQSISQWRNGEKLPTDKFRATLEKVHCIPSAAWDQRPTVGPLAPANDAPAGLVPSLPPAAPLSEDYDALIALATAVTQMEGVRPADKLRAIGEIRQLRAQKHREALRAKKPVSERDIQRSAVWVGFRELLGEALKPFPDALAAVHEAIKKWSGPA